MTEHESLAASNLSRWYLFSFEQAVEGAYKSDKRFYVFSSLSTALPYLFMFSVHALVSILLKYTIKAVRFVNMYRHLAMAANWFEKELLKAAK